MKSIIAAVLVSSCGVMPAYAQDMICMTNDEFKEEMSERNAERLFSGISIEQGFVVEVWVIKSGEWIASVSALNGQTCINVGGEHFVEPLPNA